MEKLIGIVVFGELCQERICWEELQEKLRIQVILAPSLEEFREITNLREVEGLLVEMPHARLIKKLLGNAKMIVCHPMSEPPEPEQLEAIGDFQFRPRRLRLLLPPLDWTTPDKQNQSYAALHRT